MARPPAGIVGISAVILGGGPAVGADKRDTEDHEENQDGDNDA